MTKESNEAQETTAPAPETTAPAPEAQAKETSNKVDPFEDIFAKLEERLEKKEGLETLFNNLQARVSGGVAENVAPIDKATPGQATPGQGTPDQEATDQGTPDQRNSGQGNSDQEASGKGKKEEKPKSVIEATKDYLVASFGALFDFLIEMLAGIKSIFKGTEDEAQAKAGSDVVSNNSQEQASKDNTTVSPTQISPSQKAESPLKVDGRNTRDVAGDPTSEETQPESDKPKGSLQDCLSNLIASCINDPEKMKTVADFLEKGKEGLEGEDLENFDKFKQIVNNEIDKQKGAETNQTTTGNDVEESLKESKVKESLEEGEVKESSEKSEVKESSEESENINSLDQVVEGLGGEASQENETSKKEFKDIPELDEVKRNLESGGAMRSDEGNSSSAPALAAISAPAASKDNGR